jgi:hypothetical protein
MPLACSSSAVRSDLLGVSASVAVLPVLVTAVFMFCAISVTSMHLHTGPVLPTATPFCSANASFHFEGTASWPLLSKVKSLRSQPVIRQFCSVVSSVVFLCAHPALYFA